MSGAQATRLAPVDGPAYRVLPGDARRDRARVLETWRECGASFSAAFAGGAARYDWFYLRNPAGVGRVYFLQHARSGSTVGVLGVGAREFWQAGRIVPGGLLVDFVVHPRHRIAYPATLLQRTARELELPSRPLLFGYPNSNSAPVMRRAGAQIEMAHVRYARVVDAAAEFGRIAGTPGARIAGHLVDLVDRGVCRIRRSGSPRVEWNWSRAPGGAYDELWAAVRDDYPLIGVRDQGFVAWRFFARGDEGCRALEVREPAASTLRGYFVCRRVGDVLWVEDFLLPRDARWRGAALQALVDASRAERARVICVTTAAAQGLRDTLVRHLFRERESQPILVAEVAGAPSPRDAVFTPADADT